MQPATTLVAINQVRADRAEDFLTWLRTVVVPAVRSHRPDQEHRWQVLRAEPEGDVVHVVFLFSGDDPDEWDLAPLLEDALGADGAGRALAEMSDMLVGEQQGWVVTPVSLSA